MKHCRIILLGFMCLFLSAIEAQTTVSCSLCKMDINDERFKALAKNEQGEVLQFDAIECLVNYQKNQNISNAQVVDYSTGSLLKAENAFYLKSKTVPSPMGANLSAYANKEAAVAKNKDKDGLILNWNDLKKRFEDSRFGAVDHSHHNHNRPDAYAPSGVMGDHLHPKGGLMVSLRYMNMKMDGNRSGSNEISDEAIFQDFMVAPQQMTMEMYMLGVMYAPTDKITFMLMQNFNKKEMDLTARMTMDNGMTMLRDFSTASSGLGDMKFGALFSLWSSDKTSFHLNTGFNIPIGDIENRDATPMMASAKLPYAMQLGSGTFDVTVGGTLKGNKDSFTWGIQQLNILRTGENNEGYRFGNIHELNLWGSYLVSKSVSASFRLYGNTEDDITGSDPELNPMMVTTAVTRNYGGERLRGFVGANYIFGKNKFVLGAELGLPLYQNYNGIFMNEKFTINTCLKYTIL